MSKYLIILLVVLLSVLSIGYKKYTDLKHDLLITSSNLNSVLSDNQTYISKHNQLVTTISGLELSISDFKQLNYNLYKEVSDLKIKLKNAESVIKTDVIYKYVNDTIIIPTYIDSTYNYLIRDDGLLCEIKVKNNIINTNDFKLELTDTLLHVANIKYKGWWIFKKYNGVDIHITNKNKHIKLTGTYIKLRK